MNTKEEWRDIKDYEGYYQVSDLGRVKSLERMVNCRGGKKKVRERILKPRIDKDGYLYINLAKLGVNKTKKIHRLVLDFFVGTCPKCMECCHGKGGALDNRLSNLSWGTRQKQYEDKLRDGTDCRGEKHVASKLTETQVLEIYKRAWQGDNQRELGEEFNISKNTISNIKTQSRWSWLTQEVTV